MRHRLTARVSSFSPVSPVFAALVTAVVSALLVPALAVQRASGAGQANQTSNATMFSESDAYELFMGRWSRQLAPPFVAFAGVKSGDAVLDVGSGTGALASAVLAASNAVHVTGIDPSAVYVRRARTSLGSARASFEEGDAQQLRFQDGSFDDTLSLLVVNFIPDAGMALREMVRVTKPGGVVAAAVWDYGEGMEMLRIFWDEAVAMDPSIDARDERHMPFCRPGELAALWRTHGLAEIAEVSLVIPLTFSSFDDFWLPFLRGQGPAGAHVASLSETRRAVLHDRIQKRLAATGDPFSLRARAWAVKGVVAPATSQR